MKRLMFFLLACATPALAQQTTPPAEQQSAPAPTTAQGNNAAETAGGGITSAPVYAPAGSTPASPSVAEALPAPAPLDHYPPCKPGQYDKCMEVTHTASIHKPHHHKN